MFLSNLSTNQYKSTNHIYLNKGRTYLSYSIMGLVLIIDQLVLPMFHVGTFPFKVSYFILAYWFILMIVQPMKMIPDKKDRVDFLRFTIAVGFLIICGVLGDIYVNFLTSVSSYHETFKADLIYFFAIFSFGLGICSRKFSYNWLVNILYVAVFINMLFIFYKSNLPQWLIDFYYPELTVKKFDLDTLSDVTTILELGRPRGMFSNPNGSAFMVNIIALFIYVALKKEYLKLEPGLKSVGVIMLPLFTAILLASRGEIIVATLLAVLNFKIIFKKASFVKKTSFFLIIIGVIISVFFVIINKFDSSGSFSSSLDRVYTVFNILSKAENFDVYENRNQGAARPLVMLELAAQRFSYSPLFGTGFNAGNTSPFDEGTIYFHNDWLYLLVTGGFFGFFVMLWIIKKFVWPINLVLIVPFFLPAMVNTFLLNMPTVIFYFYMIGLLRSDARKKSY